MQGGPGQALAFYGTQSTAVFPLTNISAVDDAFTLEFWVMPTCSQLGCSFFTLQSENYSEFAYVHRDALLCFGQRVVLTDGAISTLSSPPRWDLFPGLQYQPIWHHFAFSANAASSSCSIFVDGVPFVTAVVPAHLRPVNGTFFGASSRLFLGQLAFSSTPIFIPSRAFQGYIDEIRLWDGERTQLAILKTMPRSLLEFEMDASLLAYWSVDTEPFLQASGAVPNIIDSQADNTGYLIAVENVQQALPPSSYLSFATFAPSTAPIVTEYGITLLHLNLTSTVPISLLYLCLDLSANTIACSPYLTKTIVSFPSAGKLYAVNQTTGYSTPLGSTTNSTLSNQLSYEPIQFLLTQNGGFDSFRWRVLPNNGTSYSKKATRSTSEADLASSGGPSPSSNSSSPGSSPSSNSSSPGSAPTGSPYGYPTSSPYYSNTYATSTPPSMVQIYTPSSTAFTSWNSPLGSSPMPPTAVGTLPTTIHLRCASRLGDVTTPAVIEVPAAGQLYQVVLLNSTYNDNDNTSGLYFDYSDPISWGFTPTWQLVPCSNPSSPDTSCLVSHLSGNVVYVPTLDVSANDLNLTLSYVCVTPNLPGTSPVQTIPIAWSAQAPSSEITFNPSLTGNNPYAVQYDGSWSQLTTYFKSSVSLMAASVWIYPTDHSDSFGGPYGLGTADYSSQRMILEWFTSNTSQANPTQLILMRNASSYPSYFLNVVNTNLDPDFMPQGTVTLSTYSTSTLIAPNEWTNVLLTISPVSETVLVVYINGAPAGSATIGALSAPVQLNVGFSSSLGSPYLPFSGCIDDLSLWSQPFGANTALLLQFVGLATQTDPSTAMISGLTAYWDFNQGGGTTVGDRVTNHQLAPRFCTMPACMPLWTTPPADLSFDFIFTASQTPQIVSLATHANAFDQYWRLGTYVVSLPTHGTLYQLPLNFTAGTALTSSFLSTLEPITAPFSENLIQVPLIRQWASGLLGASSNRSAPVGTNYWSAEHILGTPSWWDPTAADDSISSTSPIYGDSVQSWCPDASCSAIGRSSIEWIEVGFDDAVYIQQVEVFQNYHSGAITSISAWDPSAGTWRSLFTSQPVQSVGIYTTLLPNICAITSFMTDRIRIEMNPCMFPNWYELEGVRVTGSQSLPEGVVSDPAGRVVYVPWVDNPGQDSVSYTASPCPFSVPSASPVFTYQLRVTSASFDPVAFPMAVNTTARGITNITLTAFSPDPLVTSFQYVIDTLPSIGTLYQAVADTTGAIIPGPKIVGPPPIMVTNTNGLIFYESSSRCQYNSTSFSYYVIAQGKSSAPQPVYINSLCPPSFLNYPHWLLVTLLAVLVIAMAFAILCAWFTFLKRNLKILQDERPGLLLWAATGAFIAFGSCFFVLAPVTKTYCLAASWTLHLGSMMVISGALALTVAKWTDFKNQALRSGRDSSDLPRSARVALVVSMLIEAIQLTVVTVVNPPHPTTFVSPDNSATIMSSCAPHNFSYAYLEIDKACGLVAIIIINSILWSVSPKVLHSTLVMLFSALFGVACMIAFLIPIYTLQSPSVLLALGVLALVVPIDVFLLAVFYDKVRPRTPPNQAVVETTDFGLQPISSSTGTRANANQDSVAMTALMNNHSVDKSVSDLLETVQNKDREIALLKRKLLKNRYKVRELQQKLSETESSMQQVFPAKAAPSACGDDLYEL